LLIVSTIVRLYYGGENPSLVNTYYTYHARH
jgi:hypothetical protein